MSGLVAACNKKRTCSGILKQREPTNIEGILGEAGARTNYVKGQAKAAKSARFNQHVLIRQTSDGGNRNQNGSKGTAQFYEGELGPEGVFKTSEEREASNQQRDIDYVFVYVVHKLSQSQFKLLSQIDSNITMYSEQRAREEEGRHRVAYISTKKDIYEKCVEILAKLESKHRLDVKAGKSTLTLGDDGMEDEGVMGKRWVVKLKDYLKPKASAVAVAAAASGKRRGSKRVRPTTLIF